MASGITAIIYGDTEGTLDSKAKAQTLVGLDGAMNFIYGDAETIRYSQGGNDVLTGGANSGFQNNVLHGDALKMSNSQGGNDVLTGGSNSAANVLQGDAYVMSGSRGGNDVLTGDANSYINALYGDALQMSDSKGGNDTLIAITSPGSEGFATHNMLYGDALYQGAGNGGNDHMISGTGNDEMWGDIAYSDFEGSPIDVNRVTTGQDVFVFLPTTETIQSMTSVRAKTRSNCRASALPVMTSSWRSPT